MTVDNKNVSSQCNMTAQIEQVQNKSDRVSNII
jgi:hypothetical protein